MEFGNNLKISIEIFRLDRVINSIHTGEGSILGRKNTTNGLKNMGYYQKIMLIL